MKDARVLAAILGGLLSLQPVIGAAQPTITLPGIGTVTTSASVRIRPEVWDWFDDGSAGEYSYIGALVRAGVQQQRGSFSWRVEGAAPFLLNLPDDAIAAAPEGQLGLGATYFAANQNDRDASAVFVKQLWLRYGDAGHNLRLGRFEFNDGAERAPADAVLATLKAQRIQSRLIGTFGFAHVMRSWDGAHYSWDRGRSNVTALLVRPTKGVFTVRGQPGIDDVGIGYLAWTGGWEHGRGARDLRLYALSYSDSRNVLKVDNRPLSARQADTDDIALGTLGGHWLETWRGGGNTVDVLGWAALQGGSWGELDQVASAYALEGGIQRPSLPWRPWLRAGYFWSSGDGDPGDDEHRTFFQVMPTPRPYARFPFYNSMNLTEQFVTLLLRPTATVSLRLGAHELELQNEGDLWYAGGGPFNSAFGYQGRPVGRSPRLATVTDASLEWRPSRHLVFELYTAGASGGGVVRNIYAGSGDARLFYFETTLTR